MDIVMAFFKAKVPVTLATGLICLLAGGGLGAVIMSYTLGDRSSRAAEGGGGAPGEDGEAKTAGPKGGTPKGAPAGPKGGGNKGGGGAARGPGPKVQLAALVGKLDTLTAQPLHIALTADQKKQVKEALAGLPEKDELTDDEAKAALDALLKVLEANKKTLEDAGFRWPGAAPPGGGMGTGGMGGPPNPFKAGDTAAQLKALHARLEK